MSGATVYSKFLDMVVAVKVAERDTPNLGPLCAELDTQIRTNTYSRLKVTTLVLQTTAASHSSFHPALAWLKEQWPAAPSVSKLEAPSPLTRKPVVLTPTVKPSVSPSPSPSSPSPSITPKLVVPKPAPSPSSISPSPSPVSTPSSSPSVRVSPTPVVVQRVIKPLMRSAAEQSGATVAFSWDQSSMFGHLRLPEDTFAGFCAAAVGQWFKDPTGFKALIQSQKGKIDTLNLHSGYSGSGKASYTFITSVFKFTFVNVTEVAALSRDNLWSQIIAHPGSKRMIGLLKESGGGHAVGLMTNSDKTYAFFDANEGVAEFPDHTKLHTFLYHYINDPDQGLLKTYKKSFVATWS